MTGRGRKAERASGALQVITPSDDFDLDDVYSLILHPPMSSHPIGPIRRAWLRWKTLRLPWRKRFLVGLDLQGNTFWEFRDTLSSKQGRMRRIVHYPSTVYYSDVPGKISPAWHQWLRHTRQEPPSLTEQSQDLVRQANLKVLAAEADARWAAKPSYLDAPGKERGQPVPAIGVMDPGEHSKSSIASKSENNPGVRGPINGGLNEPIIETSTTLEDTASQTFRRKGSEQEQTRRQKKEYKEDPWKKARGGPSEEWRPQAWNPGAAARR
ncbi:MAG: hypothetical protein M1818_006314 [Claussenomyces sp. TS43310]|nr:MAG: hypothetical protein M1818_006314 [Claussenomyces sp. TS43310]